MGGPRPWTLLSAQLEGMLEDSSFYRVSNTCGGRVVGYKDQLEGQRSE